MKKSDYNNAMRLESYDLQKFARQTFEINDKAIREGVPDEVYKNAKQVIACGCGDSYCAAFAAMPAYRELVGIPMCGAPAIEISRHFDSRDFKNTLFFGISSRGRTVRVIEAAHRVNALDQDATTVAIVNFKVGNSALERECDSTIHIEMPVFECGEYTEHAPCQRSYFSTAFTQMLIAVHMGYVRGNYSAQKADEYREGMIRYAEKFNNQLMDEIDDRMWALAQKWNAFRQFEVVGSGNDFPTAWFVAAKVVEAFGDIATYERTDNWMCTGRCAKDPEKTGTVVILDRDNDLFGETVEVIREMVKIGRPTVVITDADASLFPAGAEVFQIPTTEYGFAKPLMQYAPVGNMFGYITRMRGLSFYRFAGEFDFFLRKARDKLNYEPISGDLMTFIP